MKFSIPVEIGFQVLDRFMKENIPYNRSLAEDPDEIYNFSIEVDDDYVERATEIVNGVTGGQKTRSQRFQFQAENPLPKGDAS